MQNFSSNLGHLPGRQTKRHPEKGGKLNTSQAGSVAASRAAVGQFLSLFRVAFCLATRYIVTLFEEEISSIDSLRFLHKRHGSNSM